MQETLSRLETELVNALSGLDASQCQLTPVTHPDKWSIQQVVEHLLLTYGSTIDVLETRIAKGRPTQAAPSIPQRLAQFYLIGLGYFPSGRIAPPKVSPGLPGELLSGTELIARTHDALTQLSQTATNTSATFGRGRCASHMILGPLSVDQWMRFHLVHGLHHVKQIRTIRSDHRA